MLRGTVAKPHHQERYYTCLCVHIFSNEHLVTVCKKEMNTLFLKEVPNKGKINEATENGHYWLIL